MKKRDYKKYVKGLDWKHIGIMFLLGVIFFFSIRFKSNLFEFFTLLFNHDSLILILGGISAIIDITHNIKYKKFTLSHNMSFSQFKNSFEFLTSFIGNPITFVSSIALAKGLFLHWTGQEKYFPFFQSIELIFIATVTVYLLVVSSLELKKHFKEIIKTHSSDELSSDDLIPTDNPNKS